MYHIFINPAAGSGSAATLWEQVKEILTEKAIDFQAHFTEKSKSVKEVYDNIYINEKEHPVKLIVLGGDGTLNSVIQGITHPEDTELSLIRSGSGNDFARNKNLPLKLEDVISGILERKNELMIDIGLVKYSDGQYPDGSEAPDGSHRFMVSSGLGYDADICYEAEHSPKLKRLLGHGIYTYLGVKNIFTTGLADMEVTIDNNIVLYPHVYFICAMNQPVEGGGLPMTPDATDTDGLLDFCIFYGMSRPKAFSIIPKLTKGKHVGIKGVTLLRSKNIRITCSIPKMVHYDGETPAMYKVFDASIETKIKFIY